MFLQRKMQLTHSTNHFQKGEGEISESPTQDSPETRAQSQSCGHSQMMKSGLPKAGPCHHADNHRDDIQRPALQLLPASLALWEIGAEAQGHNTSDRLACSRGCQIRWPLSRSSWAWLELGWRRNNMLLFPTTLLLLWEGSIWSLFSQNETLKTNQFFSGVLLIFAKLTTE